MSGSASDNPKVIEPEKMVLSHLYITLPIVSEIRQKEYSPFLHEPYSFTDNIIRSGPDMSCLLFYSCHKITVFCATCKYLDCFYIVEWLREFCLAVFLRKAMFRRINFDVELYTNKTTFPINYTNKFCRPGP